jgi:hypothetical protein
MAWMQPKGFGGDPSRQPMPNPTDDSGKYPPIGPYVPRTPPSGYHYGIDWDSNRLFPDDPNNPNTPPMDKQDLFNRGQLNGPQPDRTMGGGEGPGGFTGQNQDPNFGQLGTIGAGPYGNRGSGQPISQPMGGYQAPGMATWTPAAGVPNGWQAGGIENPFGASGQQPLGSLQSLGGGMSQSGMVNLRGTDGTTQAVPQQDLAHWLSKGAVRI